MSKANEVTEPQLADKPNRDMGPTSSTPLTPRAGMRVIPCELAAALHEVVASAEELVDAIAECPDIRIIGCDFELQFTRLQSALSRLPYFYDEGSYIWQEIDRDFRHDAPGG